MSVQCSPQPLSQPLSAGITSFTNSPIASVVSHVRAASGDRTPSPHYDPSFVKILCLDDDAISRKFFAHTLKDYAVTTAAHPLEALEIMTKTKFDLVILDVHMPDMNGFEFLEKIHNDPSTTTIPVILISGTSKDSASATQGINSGGEDYLYKPVSRELLRKRVESILSNKWISESVKEYQQLYEQERKAGEELAADLEQKEKEISGLKAKVDEMNSMNQEVTQQLETPFKTIATTIGKLMNNSKTEPELQKDLKGILRAFTSSNLFTPAFEKVVAEQSDLDAVTRSWLLSEFTGPGAARRTSITSFPNTQNKEDTDGLSRWEFDCFSVSEDEMLSHICSMFNAYDLLNKFDIPTRVFQHFLLTVRKGYQDNPYHNFRHAFDVTQTVFSFLWNFGIGSTLAHHEILGLLIASLCHDIQHPGFNNAFQVQTQSDLAIRYNDVSVLENHHCSQTFELLRRENCNILANLEPADFKETRKVIIACILSTDMAKHFEFVSKLSERMDDQPFDRTNADDRLFIMQLLIKGADISNIAKPWKTSRKWSENLIKEFFNQGDFEQSQGMKPAPYMDRTQSTMGKTTANFIDFVAFPFFKNLYKIADSTKVLCEVIVENRKRWDQELQ